MGTTDNWKYSETWVVYGKILGRTASVRNGSSISLGGSRWPKKVVFYLQNMHLLHQKPLRVVCRGKKRLKTRTAKTPVWGVVPMALDLD